MAEVERREDHVMPLPSEERVESSQDAKEPWPRLLAALHSALDGDTADIDDICAVLDAYESNSDDWERYAHFEDHCYTRNLVDDGNGKFNVMLLCWNMGQASSIHSHSGSNCFMKILDGSLVEQKYAKPEDVQDGEPIEMLKESVARVNDTIFINDDIATHRVYNPSHSRHAVSLHVYSPPYRECACYDERTGHAHSSGTITFYSRKGELCPEEWHSGLAANPECE